MRRLTPHETTEATELAEYSRKLVPIASQRVDQEELPSGTVGTVHLYGGVVASRLWGGASPEDRDSDEAENWVKETAQKLNDREKARELLRQFLEDSFLWGSSRGDDTADHEFPTRTLVVSPGRTAVASGDDGPALLRALRQNAGDDHTCRQAVIQAEAVFFTPEEEKQLGPILLRFIEDRRDSDDPEDLVAVGSAIRKYVAAMIPDAVGSVASLLEAGHRATLPLETEVEITKMIARKFTANPPPAPDLQPELGERLFALARAYLDPYVLPRRKFAAIALNAVVALTAMLSPRASEAADVVDALPHRWFGRMLRFELKQVLHRWQGAACAVERGQAIEWMAGFIERLEAGLTV